MGDQHGHIGTLVRLAMLLNTYSLGSWARSLSDLIRTQIYYRKSTQHLLTEPI